MDYRIIYDLDKDKSELTTNNNKKQSQTAVKKSSFNVESSEIKKHKCRKCQHCDYSPKNNGKLTRHLKEVHAKIRAFQCKNCDYSAKRKHHLQLHIPICKKGRPEDLQEKSKTSAAKKVTCDTCLETFASEQEHMAHMLERGHLNDSWLKCELCKRVFSSKVGLKLHQRFCQLRKCKVCRKRLLKTNVASHMRHHQREDAANKEVNESAILFQIKHALQGKHRPTPKTPSNGLNGDSNGLRATAREGRETSINNLSQIVQTGGTAKSTCLNVENEEENEIAAEFFSADFGCQSRFKAAPNNKESSIDFHSQALKEEGHNANNSQEEVIVPYFCT